MARRRTEKLARKPKPTPPPYYIGEWIMALGARPTDVAAEAEINEGYLSELSSRKKRNPGVPLLMKIAKALGIPWNYLLNPPPEPQIARQARGFDAHTLNRLYPNEPPDA